MTQWWPPSVTYLLEVEPHLDLFRRKNLSWSVGSKVHLDRKKSKIIKEVLKTEAKKMSTHENAMEKEERSLLQIKVNNHNEIICEMV